MGNCCLKIYCKKCAVPIEYYKDYKNISKSCRYHNFNGNQCIDCFDRKEKNVNNCVHKW